LERVLQRNLLLVGIGPASPGTTQSRKARVVGGFVVSYFVSIIREEKHETWCHRVIIFALTENRKDKGKDNVIDNQVYCI
jgi:hypothetical protein